MTTKRGRPSAAEAVARDERVIASAIALLTSEGFDALTFDRVAVAAHVAKRTLYSVFGDRAGLVRAATRTQHSYLDAAWSEGGGGGDLRSASVAVVTHLLGDEAVGIHRAVMAAAVENPGLAAEFYDEGPGSAQRFLADHLPADTRVTALLLFTALLGEPHRRRLLGLDAAPTPHEIDEHVDGVLRAFELQPR